MKGYFIPFGARSILSVNKKINMQIRQLNSIGEVEEVDVKIAKKSMLRYAISILPFLSLPWDYTEAYQGIKDPDYLFIRRSGADGLFIRFLRHIKREYPNCKILCEIATYPYIGEMLQSYRGWLFLLKELYNRMYLKRYVDRFITYSFNDTILGVRTIKIMNGIEVDSVKPVSDREIDIKTINLIAVAIMRKSHGYERVIRGLKQYYDGGGKRNVVLYMVGEGKEKSAYQKLVQKLHLENNIIFCGKKTGGELDEIYERADIALSLFGAYKAGIKVISSLKTSEYLAKGLPIVSGCPEDAFLDRECKYYLEYPNDSGTISIAKLIEFYDTIYTKDNKREVVDEIRRFAYEVIDMKRAMAPVEEYITEGTDKGIKK